MAASRKQLNRVLSRLISTGVAVSPAIAISDTELHPHRQWQCSASSNGQWQCQDKKATPGAYPQAPLLTPKTHNNPQNRIQQAATTTHKQWDWVPKELAEEHNCTINTGCNGGYSEPKADWPDADKNPDTAALRASAVHSQLKGETVTLSGDVVISQGHRALKADNAKLNRNNKQLNLNGNVELREPGLLLRGNSAEFNTDTALGSIESAQVLLHESGVRSNASHIERSSDQLLNLDNASYTQCTPDDETWLLHTDHLELDNESGFGIAKGATLAVRGIPVFYSPYLSFPIDDRRKSGFLWPSFGSSGSGADIATPYYFNLAPNYDATISPRYISDRGSMAELELRHLGDLGLWRLSGAELADDDLTQTDRWLVNADQTGRFGDNWSTRVNFTRVSDNDYFRDLSITSLEVKRNTHLSQNATLKYADDNWLATLEVADYQTIDDDISKPYQRLPQLTLENRSSTENFSIDWLMLAEFTEFDHDDSVVDGGSKVTGQRNYLNTGLSYPMRWAAGHITPTVNVRHVSYQLDELTNSSDDDSPSTTAPTASLDMGLIFERDALFGESRYLQTLEPRLYYLHSDFEEQGNQPLFDTSRLTFSYSQLFRDSRFSGRDRLDDANQASLGITSRFIEDESGREVLTASVGQIFYFDDRQIQLGNTVPNTDIRSNSDIAIELSYQPSDQLWFNTSLLWESHQDEVNEGGLTLNYRSETNALYNLGYRFRRDGARLTGSLLRDLEQADISAVLPLSDHWQLYTRFQYDVTEDRSLEDLFGIAYQDCCWMVRVVYQRAVDNEVVNNGRITADRDHAVLLEFQLKGLGGLGRKTSSILEESILGYQESE